MSESKLGKDSCGPAERILDKFLECRALGHAYDLTTSTVDVAGGKYYWSLGCGGCGARRVQTLDRKGQIISTNYHYPKGYLLEGDILDKPERAKIRLRLILDGGR